MNRLILLGNGFDLAHGLKTSYNDFIKWYFKKCLTRAFTHAPFEDTMLYIEKIDYYFGSSHEQLDDYIDIFYGDNLLACEREYYRKKGFQNNFSNPYNIRVKSDLLRLLFSKCSYSTWVEVENDFYETLKNVLKIKGGRDEALKDLNDSLTTIIQELEEYLSEQQNNHLNNRYAEIFNSPFQQGDIVSTIDNINFPESTMILNFNYTSTVEKYFKVNRSSSNPIEINYIHGQLGKPDNSLIFGFGDELDEDYKTIELEKTKGFFKYIKSFWYFKTANYHNLLRFIESKKYQIFILGHSCGLSDRTMLNMLFEHQNCESVKIFYYENDDYDNFEELTHEISKHFKDKSRMRRVIVPKCKSNAMPQITVSELENTEQ